MPRPALAHALAAALVAAVAACAPGRGPEAVRLLADVAAPEPPAARRAVAYAGRDGAARHGHLYLPEAVRAGLVIVPGAAVDGLDDPRLAGFAEALRRRGFLVLVPALAGDDPLQVSAADAAAVGDAVAWLTAGEGLPATGLAALSYAVGPAMIAALEPGTGERVAFVLAVGGYHDITAAITFLTTGAFRERPDAPWRFAPVDRQAPWLFLRANAGRLADPADRAALAAIANARLADPGADIAGPAARLGPEGAAVLALLVNRDPDRVPGLLAALPTRLRAEIAALDLAARDLGALQAELLLLHGRADPLVPYTESAALAAAAPPGRARLFLLDGLDHVDLGLAGLADLARLVAAASALLAARDAAPPAGPVVLRSRR